MRTRSSLRGELNSAFFGVSFLTVICAGAALFTGLTAQKTIEQIASQQVPVLARTQSLTKITERAVAQVFLIFSVSDSQSLSEMTTDWERIDAAIRVDMDNLERMGHDRVMDELAVHLQNLAQVRAEIFASTSERLALRHDQARATSDLTQAQSDLLKVIDTMSEALDPEVDTIANAALAQLRRATVTISTTLLALPTETRPEQIKLAEVRTGSFTKRAARLATVLPEKPAHYLAEKIAEIGRLGAGAGSLTVLRENEIATYAHARVLQERASALWGTIDTDLEHVLLSSQAAIDLQIAQGRRVQNQLLLLVAGLACASVVAASLMSLIFLKRRLVHPIHNVSQQISAFEQDGNLLEPKDTAQNEIGDLAHSFYSMAKLRRSAEIDLAEKNQTLAKVNEELRDANREQAEFTYALSHDLKSPTNTLRMVVDELKQPATCQDPDLQQELVDDLSITVRRMRELIDGVLDYSQMVERSETFDVIDLDDIVAAVLKDISRDMQVAEATITCDTLGTLRGDGLQIRILFQNLLSNAIKFRRPDIAPQIEVRKLSTGSELSDRQQSVEIAVSDNGIGIDPEYKEKVFGLFQRLQTNIEFTGSGIGLAICRRIVGNHDGRIWIGSDEPPGTTVFFQI